MNDSEYELDENVMEHFKYCKTLDMPDSKAIVLSQFSSKLTEALREKDQWTKSEYMDKVQDVLVDYAHKKRKEHDVLNSLLDLLKKHRHPLFDMKMRIEK